MSLSGEAAGRRPLRPVQRVVLTTAFVPMLATGVAGGMGTFSNISRSYGTGTALGAVAAGEGATAVLALVLLGLTMLGQSSPWQVRTALWVLPAAASVMAATAAPDAGRTVIYAVTPMAMCASAEGMAFLARRIVIHTDGRDADAERRTAAVIQALAYHRGRAANHPEERVRKRSDRKSWRLARKLGTGDGQLGERLLDVQRERVTHAAGDALAAMFDATVTPKDPTVTPEHPAVTAAVTAMPPAVPPGVAEPPTSVPEQGQVEGRDGGVTQVSGSTADTLPSEEQPVTPGTDDGVTPASSGVTPDGTAPMTPDADLPVEAIVSQGDGRAVTLAEVAAVAGVALPEPGVTLSDLQLAAVLRYLRYSADPPMSYRRAADAFRHAGFVGSEKRVRASWAAVMAREESAS